MALHHMLDDRQPEPGATGVARAAAVDAVETFGQPRQVFTRYADAAVADPDLASAVFAPTPAQANAAAFCRVAHRIVQQVTDGAEQFGFAAGQLCVLTAHQLEAVFARRECRRICQSPLHQRLQQQPAVCPGARAAFKLRQYQQVAHERLHAVGLLRHQRQHSLPFSLGQRQLREGFDKTGQHGQRCADFVRDVGDEVASHRFDALALGNVLCQHQLHAAAVRPHQHRQCCPAQRPEKHDGLIEVGGLKIGHEGRRAHKVGDPLTPVARGVEAEVLCRDRVAPLDLVGRVEQ